MKKFLVFGLIVLLFAQIAVARPYRVRVFLDSPAAAQRVTDSGLGLFSDNVAIPVTDLIVEPRQFPELWALRVPYQVIQLLPPNDAWKYEGLSDSDEYQSQYLRYENIIAKYDAWMSENPDLITKIQIGTTIQNRPIYAYRIFKNYRFDQVSPPRNAVFFCGIHAREWISPSVGMYVMDMLIQDLRNPSSQMHQKLADKCAVSIIPSLNPDGYVYTWDSVRLWRKNRRPNGGSSYGVDLNRNWPTGWNTGGGSSGNTNSETYRGPSPASERETQAARDYALSLQKVVAFIDFHSYGEYILWPWAYTNTVAAGASWLHTYGLQMQAAIAGVHGHTYTEGQAYQVLYEADGTTKDYFYSQFNAAAYTIELRDTGDYGFLLPEAQIFATQQEGYAGAKALLAAVVP